MQVAPYVENKMEIKVSSTKEKEKKRDLIKRLPGFKHILVADSIQPTLTQELLSSRILRTLYLCNVDLVGIVKNATPLRNTLYWLVTFATLRMLFGDLCTM